MPILNFQFRVVDLIKSGKKCQAISGLRIKPIKKDDKLFLYSGLKTKKTELISIKKCKSVETINLGHNYVYTPHIKIQFKKDLDNFAKEEGFENYDELCKWLNQINGLPFLGVLIKW